MLVVTVNPRPWRVAVAVACGRRRRLKIRHRGAGFRFGHADADDRFASEQALTDYADSPAQLEWYKVYMPIREESTTFDITN